MSIKGSLLALLSFGVYTSAFSQQSADALFNKEPGFIVSHSGDTIRYETAFFNVPENRKNKNSKTISPKVLMIKSQSSTPKNPVVFLAGGPGQSGINYIKQDYFQAIIASLLRNHDVILLDQRGCGGSQPSLIYRVPASNKKNVFLSPESIIEISNIQAKAGADTMKQRGIDIKGYNTVENAHDLLDLSIALGAKKINVLAISYGTHLALAAARQHPELIEKMVLIGTSGPDDMHHLPSTYDEQLYRISELAAVDTAVNRKVPDMVALLKKVLSKLDKNPVEIKVNRNETALAVGKFGLQFILRLDVGDAYDFVLFPAMLYGIDNGNYQLLQEYVEKRYNQLNGDYSSAIGVMRTASGASKKRLARIVDEGKTAMLGNSMNTPDIYGENFWGNIDLGDEYRKTFKSDVHTLLISGSMDSNTPVSNATEVAAKFTNTSHVIAEYAGHEDMLSNPQVAKLLLDYLEGVKPIGNKIVFDKPVFEPIP